MVTSDQSERDRIDETVRSGIRKRIVQVVFFVLYQAGILFLTSGRLDWRAAWVYLGVSVAAVLINAFFMLRRHPGTVAERSRSEGMKGWDKLVGGLWGIVYFIVLLCVCGLDARFGWSGRLPLWVHFLGGAGYVAGATLFSWAMITNAYFSAVVRIQDDRGHQVCSDGPYRLIRHPGYTGAILQSVCLPFMLGSYWALIPGIVAGLLMATRTLLEDRMLLAELDGYREFADQTRYRLVPGLW